MMFIRPGRSDSHAGHLDPPALLIMARYTPNGRAGT